MSRSDDPRPSGSLPASAARSGRRAGTIVRWRCVTCGAGFAHQTGKSGFEAHADTEGHRRIEVVLK